MPLEKFHINAKFLFWGNMLDQSKLICFHFFFGKWLFLAEEANQETVYLIKQSKEEILGFKNIKYRKFTIDISVSQNKTTNLTRILEKSFNL